MTAVSPDSWGRRSRLVAWWAHHEGLWGFNGLGVAISIFLSDFLFPNSLFGDVISIVVAFLFLPGYLMQSMATNFHFTYLCVECMQKVPEDAGVRAQSHLGRLRAYHLTKGKGMTFLALALVIALIIPAGFSLWHSTMLMLLYILMAVENFLSAFHRPLVMYCPWCKWDGGGEHEHAPTPIPTMIKTS